MKPLSSSDPRVVGSWVLVGRLGSGGMGVVYLGEKGSSRVAIKVVRASFLDDASLKSRVIREIAVLRRIKSFNVASIIEADVSSEFAWFASEFVDGPNLKEFVEFSGPLSFYQWLFLAEGLFEAFDAIHQQNVIHRDVKPTNILIGPDGPKVIDFGIALTDEATSLTSTGLVAGSPAWLSPEQINDRTVNKASDLFSLGSVLTYAATGNSPWNKENTTKTAVIFHRILTEKPNISNLNEFQKDLVSKLLSKNPKDRPSANEAKSIIKKEIKRIKNKEDANIDEEKINLTSTEIFKPSYTQSKQTKIKKPILVGVASSAIIIAGIFGFNFFNSTSKTQETITAKGLPETIQTNIPTPSPSQEQQTSEEFSAAQSPSPTPTKTTPTPSPTPTKEETTNTKKNSNGSTIIDLGGEKIELVKTRICLTIFQHGASDSYCYKDNPIIKAPLYYVDSNYNGGFSAPLEDLVTISVPYSKANIFTCFNKAWSGSNEYYTSGVNEQILYDLGTATIVYNDQENLKFCEKYGDWKFGVKNPPHPPYEVLAFKRDKTLPLDFTWIVNTGSLKYTHVWTWSKIK
jgi:serine/threonine protein kinase